MLLNIKEALDKFKEQNPEKRNQDIAIEILPEKSEKRARELFSRWCNGHDYSAITPEVVVSICRVLKITPNYLFDYLND